MTKELHTNKQIKAKEVLLIGATGTQLGILPIEKALQIANEQDLDLVKMPSDSTPPVCKLLDYGKYRFQQSKQEQKARKNQKGTTTKEIRIKPRMKDHDLAIKTKKAKELLEKGNKVKLFVFFRGREITHPELGLKLLNRAIEELKDIATFEGTPSLENHSMNVVLSPIKSSKSSYQNLDKNKNVC